MEPLKVKAGNTTVEVCPNCGTPIGPVHSYQAPDGKIYKRRACIQCNIVFSLEGPYRTHGEAVPR